MRRVVCLATVLALAASGAARADEPARLKAIIDKAIKASGGEAKLARLKGETFKGKGKYYGMGEGIDYTGEWSVQPPGKMRVHIESTAGGQTFTFLRVLNGDKLWTKIGDEKAEEAGKDETAEAKEEAYAGWVATLLPLREKGFMLSSLAEVKVNGKPAVGVQVSHKGHRDVRLFFDKETGLLVKSETTVKDPRGGGQEQTQEAIYSDHKDVDGVKHPMKVVINRDGKKYVDLEVTEIERKDKIDDSVFAKP
jgi:outer membrane lipoprotein-sorting protein